MRWKALKIAGLEDSFSNWLTHLASTSMLALSQRPHLHSTGAPDSTVTAYTRERNPRDQGKARTSQVTHHHLCQEGPALVQWRRCYKSTKTWRQWEPSQSLVPRESKRLTVRHCGCSRGKMPHIHPPSCQLGRQCWGLTTLRSSSET